MYDLVCWLISTVLGTLGGLQQQIAFDSVESTTAQFFLPAMVDPFTTFGHLRGANQPSEGVTFEFAWWTGWSASLPVFWTLSNKTTTQKGVSVNNQVDRNLFFIIIIVSIIVCMYLHISTDVCCCNTNKSVIP